MGLIVLLCAIVGKGSLLLMTNAVGHVETNAQNPYKERWVWMLIVTICSPYLFSFFDSIFKSLFGNKPWPTLKILVLVLLVETAHSFGISIFVFRVLPKLDLARAILMMNAVCTVPGILKFFLSKTHVSTAKRLIIFIMDLCAVLMQCTVFGIVFASKYMFKSSSRPSGGTSTSLDAPSISIDAGGADTDHLTTESLFESDSSRLRRHIGAFIVNQTTSILSKRSAGEFDDLFEMTPSGAPGIPAGKANSSVNVMFEDILSSFQIEWELPIALMLVSLVWWENFVDRDIKCGSFKLVNMKLLKENILATRCKTNFISSLWKIAVTILFAYLFHPGIFNTSKIFRLADEPVENRFKNYGADLGVWGLNPSMMNMGQMNLPPPPPLPLSKRSLEDALGLDPNGTTRRAKRAAFTAPQMFIPSFSTPPNIFNVKRPNFAGVADFGGDLPPPPEIDPPNEPTYKDFWITYLIPMLLQVFCSGLCYYTGRLACKLCMQRLGFALPLTLVTPVTLSVGLILCKWFPESAVFQPDFVYWTCHEGYQTGSFKWQVICGLGLWWLSQLWIGGHVWFGKGQRLAFTERLFVLPGYCGVLTEQSLMMNRRRYDRPESYSVLENSGNKTANEETDSNASIESDDSKLKKDVNIVIYSCATMWHETETEMLQLLKSIMRLDIDQSARRKAQEYFGIKDPDFYEYEGHIFFDDAMEEDENGEMVPNRFVEILVSVMDQAAT